MFARIGVVGVAIEDDFPARGGMRRRGAIFEQILGFRLCQSLDRIVVGDSDLLREALVERFKIALFCIDAAQFLADFGVSRVDGLDFLPATFGFFEVRQFIEVESPEFRQDFGSYRGPTRDGEQVFHRIGLPLIVAQVFVESDDSSISCRIICIEFDDSLENRNGVLIVEELFFGDVGGFCIERRGFFGFVLFECVCGAFFVELAQLFVVPAFVEVDFFDMKGIAIVGQIFEDGVVGLDRQFALAFIPQDIGGGAVQVGFDARIVAFDAANLRQFVDVATDSANVDILEEQ